MRTTLRAARLPADDDFLARHTHELSGGQLQRVALARALVLEPKLLVADEPVSMLDPSEQAKVLQLLKQLQVDRGMAMILVSHDLAAVLRVADRVLVMDGGRVVEEGSGSDLLMNPRHPATRALLDAAGRDLLFEPDNGTTSRIETMGLRRIAILAACVLLVGSCASDKDDQAQSGGQTTHPESVARLRLSGGDYGYPSPFGYLRGAGLILASYVFDTLLWEDSTGDPIPWLAKEWSHSPDGLEWRFTLRDNAKWQDGRPVTAEDVKFSFDYVTTGAASSVSRLSASLDLKEVVVDGPDTVVIRLNKPTAVFEEDVALRLFIIPRHIWSRSRTRPSSAGPARSWARAPTSWNRPTRLPAATSTPPTSRSSSGLRT